MDEEAIRGMFSDSDALRFIGAEIGEVWQGDVLRKGVMDLFDLPAHSHDEDALDAYECGKIGWAFWQGTVVFEDGDTEVRAYYYFTYVFALEQGAWKIIHLHVANPDSKFEQLGLATPDLDALVNAAQDGPLGVGTASMASIMFTDVVDSSALADVMGDKLWTKRIDSHLADVRTIIEDNGGTLVKSLGDGTMSTFTSSRSALAAARDIQNKAQADQTEPNLRLRIGLQTGEVIENKGDFFGTVVNKAARVASVANPDEIRVSDATRAMIGGNPDFTLTDPINIPLKGLEGEHMIYRLDWQS